MVCVSCVVVVVVVGFVIYVVVLVVVASLFINVAFLILISSSICDFLSISNSTVEWVVLSFSCCNFIFFGVRSDSPKVISEAATKVAMAVIRITKAKA